MPSLREIYKQSVGQTSEFSLSLEVDRASGSTIYGSNGRDYIDFNSGISVSSVGHGNPQVTQAIKRQVDKHLHTMVYGEHVQSPQVSYAQLLSEQLADSLNSVYYLSSGSEVIEAAMKLAKRATGRYEIISAANAYHGSTQGAESLRSDHAYSRAFLPLIPGVRHIQFNDYENLNKITTKTAAVIMEPVQAEAGVLPPAEGYLKAVSQRCDETQTLFVLDEIQTGFGRTGALFAHQKYEVTPDILCIGKAMGGGMPIGALVANKDLLSAFTKHPDLGHITTFGGHPVTCAAAQATLEVLLDTEFISEVAEKEAYIKERLQHTIVKEVRSSGLMMAVELTKRKYLKHVVGQAYELGALVDYFLFNNRAFRLAPPLVYKMDELEAAMDIMVAALHYAERQYG